jgi:hypothetical protein
MRWLRIGLLSLLATVSIGVAQAAPPPSDPPAAPAVVDSGGGIVQRPQLFTPDDLLLFEFDVGGQQLTDALGAYSSRGGVFLPLGALSRLLDLAVTVDPGRKRADGWIIAESRAFRLDLNAGRAEADGATVPLTVADAAAYNDDIYVRAEVLEKILPINLKVDARGLVITATAREVLPFQAQMERQKRNEQMTQAGAREPELVVTDPYRLFTPPSADLILSIGGGNHSPTATYGYDLRLAGDLAFASAQFHASSNDQGRLDSLTLLFDRKDPSGHLFGPLGLTRFDLGDTYTPQLPLGARTTGGRGVAFTSEPLEEASVFNKIDIRGELPSGYQVELYVNEVLKASQLQPVDGRYDFPGVDLAYGLNVIRLVFYGSHGERREEVRRVNVGGGQLAKGQTTFSFGVVQNGTPTLDVLKQQLISGVTTTGDIRISGEVAHGLTNATTIMAGFAQYTPRPDDQRELGVLGVTTSLFGYSARANVAFDNKQSGDIALGLAGRPFGVSMVVRDSEYFGDFQDEFALSGPSDVALRRDTMLNLSANAHLWRVPVPLQVNLERAQFADGSAQFVAGVQTSMPVWRYLVSSSLNYQSLTGGRAPNPPQFGGELDATGLADGSWQVRASLAYSIQPDTRITSVSLSTDKPITDKIAVHFGVGESFGSGAGTTLQIAGTWRLRAMDLSLTSSFDSARHDARVGLQLSFGMGFDPFRHRYASYAPGVATGGGMAIDAFADTNGDGVREPGEAGEPGIVAEGGRGNSTTDAAGRLVVTGLGDASSARVRLNLEALGDPYLASPPTTLVAVPRPGRIAPVRYPITTTGEVELKFNFLREGYTPHGLASLSVELLNDKGAVVAHGRTEYDGTVLIEGLHAGVYDVRIAPDQAQRLHMALRAPLKVKVTSAGGFVGEIDGEVVLTTRSDRETEVKPSASGTPAPCCAAADASAGQKTDGGPSVDRQVARAPGHRPTRHPRGIRHAHVSHHASGGQRHKRPRFQPPTARQIRMLASPNPTGAGVLSPKTLIQGPRWRAGPPGWGIVRFNFTCELGSILGPASCA